MANDPTRLRGDGATITLRDGTTRRVVFDFDALCEIEEGFGALRSFTKRLAGDSSTKLLQTILLGVHAGLRHCDPAPSLDQVRRELLDTKRIPEYRDALDAAFIASMPEHDDTDEDAGPKGNGESDSPGTTSTSSSPSATAAPTASSGE